MSVGHFKFPLELFILKFKTFHLKGKFLEHVLSVSSLLQLSLKPFDLLLEFGPLPFPSILLTLEEVEFLSELLQLLLLVDVAAISYLLNLALQGSVDIFQLLHFRAHRLHLFHCI